MPDYIVKATLIYEREVEFTVQAEDEDAAHDVAQIALDKIKDSGESEEEELSKLPDWSGGCFSLYDFDVDSADEA